MDTILQVVDLCKDYGGVHAVSHLSFSVRPCEILGIIGPNGSGKTTFFNVLTGIDTPTSGKFLFRGEDITRKPAHVVARLGISRTFQNLRQFRALTVRDNVIIGQHTKQTVGLARSIFRGRSFHGEEKRCRERADEMLQLVGLGHMANRLAGEMSYGQQKRLELARALAPNPELLLLDEPAAGIQADVAAELMELIHRLPAIQGCTILLIEHNMKIIKDTTDRIIAMDNGALIADGDPDRVLSDPQVIQAYLGKDD